MGEVRNYDPVWMGQYRTDTNSYYGAGSPIRVGGQWGYYSLMGFPNDVLADMQKSKTTPIVRLSIYVTDAADFNIGIHKETYNKASGSLPAVRYSGLHPMLSSGARRKVDISDLPAIGTSLQSQLEAGYRGIAVYGDVGGSYGTAYGLTGNIYRVLIEVEGTWNSPPSVPKVIYPNGGETLSGIVTLRAEASTDPEEAQSALRYQWGIYDGSWHYFGPNLPGVTDIDVDFTQFKESSVAKVAVRAFDSSIDYDHGNYGAWDYSDGVFSIRRNVPPDSPSELKPSGGQPIDRTDIQELIWKHNDSGNQSKFNLRWRIRGSSTWNNVSKDGVESRYLVPANTFPTDSIEWQVQTYDDYGLMSPWSDVALFVAAPHSDRPIILSPASREEIEVANPVIEWSASDQQAYHLSVYNGNQLVYDETISSENKAVTLGYNLENNQSYTIELSIQAASGLWSDKASISISTSFIEPPAASLEILTDEERGSITLTIINPNPSEIEPVLDHNVIYRREVGKDWVLVADHVPGNFSWTDFSPASGVNYEYMVEAHGINNTISQSVPFLASVLINQTIISVVEQPEKWIGLKYNPSVSFKPSVDTAVKKFSGRSYPMAEIGEGNELGISLKYTIRSDEDLNVLEDIMEQRQTLLYRDQRKRKEYIVIPDMDISYMKSGNYEVSFSPIRVWYKGEDQ